VTPIHPAVFLILAVIATLPPDARAASSPTEAVQRGRNFLVSLMDPELDLLPEYRDAKVYWLFHDNYLAAKTLATSHPKAAQRITAAIRGEGIEKSGKIQLLFDFYLVPNPFRKSW
jgi:hypothetical protein